MKRKEFISVLWSSSLIGSACNQFSLQPISVTINGPAHHLGHQLRQSPQPVAKETKNIKTLIIGGGVSGLTTAYFLKKNGYEQFLLLELNDRVGGNALAGNNHITGYPYGAHYITIPDANDKPLISFLHEVGIIVGFNEQQLPIINEEFICHAPDERHFMNGIWNDGLIPHQQISEADRQQFQRFFALMHEYKLSMGEDGKHAFTIPVQSASMDEKWLKLDDFSFHDFLTKNEFTSGALYWYINYCLKDDFGGDAQQVSAWAGLHYFASRRGNAANAESDAVITWPEGNYWLVNKLKKDLQDHIINNSLAVEVDDQSKDAILVKVKQEHHAFNVKANQVVMATPHFINKRLLKQPPEAFNELTIESSPWAVINITLNADFASTRGIPLSWDNIIYGAENLGYVHAQHQAIRLPNQDTVITLYYCFCKQTPALERQKIQRWNEDDWKTFVIDELKQAHPNIKHYMSNIEVWIWGHGMVLPAVGLKKKLLKIKHEYSSKRILFAHTDYSGISIFEEAFHQGLSAANQILHAHQG